MKFFLISDNIDTLMGLRLVGIEGVVSEITRSGTPEVCYRQDINALNL